MAEEYHHGGICGGWWSGGASGHAIVAASPCSLGFNDPFGCPNDIDMIKSRSTSTTCAGEIHIINSSSNLVDSVRTNQDHVQNPHENSDQMIGFGLNSSTTSTVPSDLNQALHIRNYQNFMLPDDQMANNQDFSLEQNGTPPNSYVNNGFTSQLLYDPEVVVPQPQSLFNNGSSSMNYGSINSNNDNPSPTCWPSYSSSGLRPSQQGGGGLQFSNINTPFWNAPAPSLNHDIRSSAGLFPSTTMSPSQYVAPSQTVTNSSNFAKANTNEDVQDSSSSTVKKSGTNFSSSSEPVFKRARIETPSPLPTFKVRKEKLGDRITALQQFVSPFGKTDTASVLHEAIEYIKFLHDQVGVLSTPYMNNGAPMQNQQGCHDKLKESEKGGKQDLQSRGLCLVPVSSTYPVAHETTADFWTPTFGATSFR